jgi:hypothetical protein
MGNYTAVTLQNQASQFVTAATDTATAITDVSPLPDFTFAAGSLQPGNIIRVTAVGAFVTSSGATTMTVQIMYGGTGGTSLFTTGAVTLTATAGNSFKIESIIRILTTGTSGTCMVDSRYQGISTTANVGVPVMVRSASVTIDTTTAKTLILACTQAVALTSFNVDTFLIEQLN